MSVNIISELKNYGLKCKIIPFHYLNEIKKQLIQYRNDDIFSKNYYEFIVSHFIFEPPEKFQNDCSVIILAVPQYKVQVTFHLYGTLLNLFIPPTYLLHPDEKVQAVLSRILDREGFQIHRAKLPLKYMAVCSGLASYGRNNITYIDKWGSFYRLLAFYSNIPCQEDNWRKPEIMKICNKCIACINNCPTGAISPDRILLHAEKCLTFINERPGDFPKWIDSSWHHCIVGCLRCQTVCPQNKIFLDRIERREEFSEKETVLLLQSDLMDKLPIEIEKKLDRLGLTEYSKILPRNLRVLFDLNT